MEKFAVRILALFMAVAFFSCAGSGQKPDKAAVDKPADNALVNKVEDKAAAQKPLANPPDETASVEKAKDTPKVVRSLDKHPTEMRTIKPNIPEEYKGLVVKFDKYWGAIKASDYKAAYDLESAAFQKTTGFDQYKGRFGNSVVLINVTALGVKKISEKEVIVTGSMLLKANMAGPKDIFKALPTDRWVKEGGEWRHVPKIEKK